VTKAVGTLLAVLAAVLSGCAKQASNDVPDLWKDLAYDQHLTLEQLREAGWRCSQRAPDAEGIDADCKLQGGPNYSVFGVPSASGTVFLKGGQYRYLNTQLHGTSGLFVAENLARRLGKPRAAFNDDGSCALVWDRHSGSWKMYLENGDPTKHVTLYTGPGDWSSAGLPATSPWGKVKAWVSRMPCAEF
jgi:hypothetical protein